MCYSRLLRIWLNFCVIWHVTWHFFLQTTPAKSTSLLSATNGSVGDDDEEDEEEFVDVPYTYEVEEIQEQEVMKEDVVERTLPQVRAMYNYKGNGMEMDKGEVRWQFWR